MVASVEPSLVGSSTAGYGHWQDGDSHFPPAQWEAMDPILPARPPEPTDEEVAVALAAQASPEAGDEEVAAVLAAAPAAREDSPTDVAMAAYPTVPSPTEQVMETFQPD